MDSAVVLAIARLQGFACEAISFDYGQRHRFELESAARVARALGAAGHTVLPIDMRAIGGSALTDSGNEGRAAVWGTVVRRVMITLLP